MNKYRYRISEIKLNLSDGKEELVGKILKKTKIKRNELLDFEIVRESIDARNKGDIKRVYTIDFSTNRTLKLALAPNRDYIYPAPKLAKDKKVVVVGFGPAGMFSALILAEMGYRPLVIERGPDVDTRTRDVESFWRGGTLKEDSNVQFGEGGAGTFSDGKLTTGISDSRTYKVLMDLVRFGGPGEILYKHKPHIGTDLLKEVVKGLREEVIRLGGKVLFNTKLVDLEIEDNLVKNLIVSFEGRLESLPCHEMVLAIGHSARDTFKMLYDKNIKIEQKPFSMGLRIEHPQELINEAQYGRGDLSQELGAADYKLSHRTKKGRGVYTFCMCPGGEVVVASSQEGTLVSNGMSYHARDSRYANSGLLVDVKREDFGSDHPLAGVHLQEFYERKAFDLAGSYKLLETDIEGFKDSDLAKALPEFVVEGILEALPKMGLKIKGFDGKEAVLKGPETRSSSPLRIYRDSSTRSNILNLHPCGEGAGYAGGIMSAAVDGIKTAEKIISEDYQG